MMGPDLACGAALKTAIDQLPPQPGTPQCPAAVLWSSTAYCDHQARPPSSRCGGGTGNRWRQRCSGVGGMWSSPPDTSGLSHLLSLHGCTSAFTCCWCHHCTCCLESQSDACNRLRSPRVGSSGWGKAGWGCCHVVAPAHLAPAIQLYPLASVLGAQGSGWVPAAQTPSNPCCCPGVPCVAWEGRQGSFGGSGPGAHPGPAPLHIRPLDPPAPPESPQAWVTLSWPRPPQPHPAMPTQPYPPWLHSPSWLCPPQHQPPDPPKGNHNTDLALNEIEFDTPALEQFSGLVCDYFTYLCSEASISRS